MCISPVIRMFPKQHTINDSFNDALFDLGDIDAKLLLMSFFRLHKFDFS